MFYNHIVVFSLIVGEKRMIILDPATQSEDWYTDHLKKHAMLFADLFDITLDTNAVTIMPLDFQTGSKQRDCGVFAMRYTFTLNRLDIIQFYVIMYTLFHNDHSTAI